MCRKSHIVFNFILLNTTYLYAFLCNIKQFYAKFSNCMHLSGFLFNFFRSEMIFCNILCSLLYKKDHIIRNVAKVVNCNLINFNLRLFNSGLLTLSLSKKRGREDLLKRRLNTVHLHIKIACFVKNYTIFINKSSWSKLVSSRGSSVVIFSLQ